MKAKEILSLNQLKYSRQREALIELLQQEALPMSIDQIIEKLKKSKHPMNQSTVYRIIESLNEHHIVEKNYSSISNSTLIQLHTPHHQHYLMCQMCHKMFPIDNCPIHDVIDSIEIAKDFKIISHNLEIIGICASCQKKAQG
ncbi:MAG TPA: Fur family transcriptional regulator [Erysipelotrichaceae bacterium]|nr:Fur family transcriptional regulator [Erysipelotrichaceae bacterium]